MALFAWSSQAAGFFTGRYTEADSENPATKEMAESLVQRGQLPTSAAGPGTRGTERCHSQSGGACLCALRIAEHVCVDRSGTHRGA